MNILLVYKEADIATYKMLEGLSKLEDFNIYIASPQSYTDKKIYGNCTPLDLPVITSKFNWNVIRALREIIKTYRIDLIYSPSSSGLSNALFASIGTRAKNIAYRGTQAKLKRFDPTYYLGILNPAVEHVVCETKDIEEVVYTSLAPGCLPESRAGGYGLFRSLYRNRHTGSKRLNHRRSHRIVSAAFFSSKNGGVYPLAYR